MGKRLYDLMNWPEIEGIVYSECDAPKSVLGAHQCKDGTLIQVFRPDAVEIEVRAEGRKTPYPMEKMDESGFFAAFIPVKKKFSYKLIIEDIKGKKSEIYDAYSFDSNIREQDMKKFLAGTAQDAYRYMGSHAVSIKGVDGMSFAVWAPNARRVSVVGDFNNWDGRIYQMQKCSETGIFTIFIPGLEPDTPYCYEVKLKDGQISKKSDPYCTGVVNDVYYASVADYDKKYGEFTWTDGKWKRENNNSMPMSVCEVDILDLTDDKLPDKIAEMRFNYAEIMNVCPVLEGANAQTINFYGVNPKVGSDRLKTFIDELHNRNIGVILDWNGAFMSQEAYSLVYFDGTHLYDTGTVRLDNHPEYNAATFDFSKPEVRSFLYSNLRYWLEEYHVDGFKFSEVASMLYLDYGRDAGQWIPNIYGGKENLAAIDFIRGVRTMFDTRKNPPLMIAEETSAWPLVTGKLSDDGLGFDYKWNDGWKKEFISFIGTDPLFRKGLYGRLTYSLLYQYSERFMVGFSRNGYGWQLGLLSDIVPKTDNPDDTVRHIQTAVAYMYMHPGKKLLNIRECMAAPDFVRTMNSIYMENPAMYELDDDPQGFEWIDDVSVEETVFAMLRRAEDGSIILAAINFTPVERKQFALGVPFAGKYRDLLDDNREYCSNDTAWNGRDNSVRVDLKPLGVSVYSFTPYTEIELEKMRIKREAKEALEVAMRQADEAKRVQEEAEERARQAKEAEKIAFAAAEEALEAKRIAVKKAEEARRACLKIDEEARRKLEELKVMEAENGQ